MKRTSLAVFAAMFLSAGLCHAEILHGIEALDTLGDIRKRYPNATIVRVKAAWVKADEDFFSLEGPGFPGSLRIAFNDSRPWNRKMVEEVRASDKPDSGTSVAFYEKGSNASDDDALRVWWVRWIPDSPIPIARYKSKYGPPSNCDFKPDDLSPFCEWKDRGLSVALSDDQKSVLSAEANFTKAEQAAAWQAKFGFVPDSLKDELRAVGPSPTKKAPAKAK